MKKLMLTVAALSLLISPAMAQEMAKKQGGVRAVDANNDGVVSTAEAENSVDIQFEKLDKNKDSQISKDEFKQTFKIAEGQLPPKFLAENKGKIEKAGMRRFENLDADKNNSLSKDELKADMRARHKKMDKNGDGNVTREELKAFHTKMKKMIEQKAK